MSLAIILSVPLLTILVSNKSGKRQNVRYNFTAILAFTFILLMLWINPPGTGESQDIFPPSLVSFIKKYHLSGKIFNNQRIGGFLTYHLYPQNLVYADTRDDLFLDTPVLTSLESTLAGKNILPLIDSYQADIVVADLADGQSYQAIFYTPQWAVVYLDERYMVAIPKDQARVNALPVYDALDPFSPSGTKARLAEKGKEQYEKLIREHPESNELHLRLAKLLLTLGDARGAIGEALLVRVPKGPQATLLRLAQDELLAEANLAQKDCQAAKKSIEALDRETRGKLLFQPLVRLPSNSNKAHAFYSLICDHDTARARSYLEQYLGQNNVSPLEKITTEKAFKSLLQ